MRTIWFWAADEISGEGCCATGVRKSCAASFMGALGERITRNVASWVRREDHRGADIARTLSTTLARAPPALGLRNGAGQCALPFFRLWGREVGCYLNPSINGQNIKKTRPVGRVFLFKLLRQSSGSFGLLPAAWRRALTLFAGQGNGLSEYLCQTKSIRPSTTRFVGSMPGAAQILSRHRGSGAQRASGNWTLPYFLSSGQSRRQCSQYNSLRKSLRHGCLFIVKGQCIKTKSFISSSLFLLFLLLSI